MVVCQGRLFEVAFVERFRLAETAEVPEAALVGVAGPKAMPQNMASPTQTLILRFNVSEPFMPVTVTL